MNSAKMNYKCDECGIKLNRFRDGSDEPNFRCNNCYWEDTEGEFSGNIITPDYRKEEEDEDEVKCTAYLNRQFPNKIGECECGCDFEECPCCGDEYACSHCGLCEEGCVESEKEDEFECFSCKKMVKETEYLPSKEDEEKQQLLGNDYCLECYKKLDKD